MQAEQWDSVRRGAITAVFKSDCDVSRLIDFVWRDWYQLEVLNFFRRTYLEEIPE